MRLATGSFPIAFFFFYLCKTEHHSLEQDSVDKDKAEYVSAHKSQTDYLFRLPDK